MVWLDHSVANVRLDNVAQIPRPIVMESFMVYWAGLDFRRGLRE